MRTQIHEQLRPLQSTRSSATEVRSVEAKSNFVVGTAASRAKIMGCGWTVWRSCVAPACLSQPSTHSQHLRQRSQHARPFSTPAAPRSPQRRRTGVFAGALQHSNSGSSCHGRQRGQRRGAISGCTEEAQELQLLWCVACCNSSFTDRCRVCWRAALVQEWPAGLPPSSCLVERHG